MSRAEPLATPADPAGAAIVAGLGGPAFLTGALGRRRHAGRADPVDAVTALVGFGELTDVAARVDLRPPRIRMYHDGPVDPGGYVHVRQSRTELVYGHPDPAKIRERLGEGATLVIGGMEKLLPAVGETNRSLRWWLGCPVHATAYAVVGRTAGFAPHTDDHDVIVVQTAGVKHWRLWEPTRRHPLERDVARPERPATVAEEVEMCPGDVMYLPRGHWHSAATTDPDDVSVHLTFGVRRHTGVDWVAWLADRLRASESFRADLPVFAPDDDRAAHRERLLAELTAVADSDDWCAYVLQDRASTEPDPVPELRPRPVVSAGRVRLTCAFAPEVTVDDGALIVRAGRRRFRFDLRCAPLIDLLATGRWVQRRELEAALPPTGGAPAARLVDDLLDALAGAGLLRTA